jgi:hypothetical protein
MKKILLLGFIFAVICGCKSPVPKEIIQPDQMQKILYDMHLVDGYINSIPLQDSAKRVAAAYYKGVYKKFGIDSVSYAKSMDFYYANPELMNEMYVKLETELKKNKVKVEKLHNLAIEKLQKKRQDSVKADSIKQVAKQKKDSLQKESVKPKMRRNLKSVPGKKGKDANNQSTL